MYRKSGASNDQLTKSILHSDRDQRRGIEAEEKADLYNAQRATSAADG